jgi:hypothetical protein
MASSLPTTHSFNAANGSGNARLLLPGSSLNFSTEILDTATSLLRPSNVDNLTTVELEEPGMKGR